MNLQHKEHAVLDASVALSWVMPDEESRPTLPLRQRAALEDSVLVAPPTFWFEVANALWVAIRRDRLTNDLAERALHALESFGIEAYDCSPPACLALATSKGMAVYDSAYVVCAVDLNAPIWTIDVKMSEVSREMGLTVLP